MRASLFERIIAALGYLTMGVVSFIWILIAFFRKASLGPFLQYHLFQSVFISVAFFMLNMACGFMLYILSYVPLINKLVAWITFMLNTPLIGPYSLIQAIIFSIVLYLAFTSFMGAYSRIIWVSDIINYHVGRK